MSQPPETGTGVPVIGVTGLQTDMSGPAETEVVKEDTAEIAGTGRDSKDRDHRRRSDSDRRHADRLHRSASKETERQKAGATDTPGSPIHAEASKDVSCLVPFLLPQHSVIGLHIPLICSNCF